MNTPLTHADDKIDLFDVLLVLSRNRWLLLFGPLIVAILVVGALSLLPPRFASEALVILPGSQSASQTFQNSPPAATQQTAAQVVVVMKSAAVLDAVLLALHPEVSEVEDAARNALGANLTTAVVKDGLIRVEATASTPQDAQKTASALIDAWLHTTRPATRQRAELEKRLAHAKENWATTQAVLASRKAALASVAGLGELLDRYFAQTLEVERAMSGLSRDVVVQSPTLPRTPKKVPYFVIFLQVFFAAGLLILMWIMGKHAFKRAGTNPIAAEKLNQLKISARFFRPKENSTHE